MKDIIKNIIRNYIRESISPFYGIAYTGVHIESHEEIAKLEEILNKTTKELGIDIPNDWKSPEDYHMTVCLGELPLHLKMRGDLNSEVVLTLTHIGHSDVALAFKVTGYMSKNDVQHITMRFLEKPADSKEITQWYPLSSSFNVKGIIREIPKKQP